MNEPLPHPSIDELAMEYLRGAEAGQPPDLEALAARLPDETARQELRELVGTTDWLQQSFPVAFRPRTVIADRFVLLEELGNGGFGKVWRAEDPQRGRDVAIKLFHQFLDPDEIESTLRRERDSLARLHHDGIVPLVASGRHDDTWYLATEFVPGCTLDRVVAALAARSALGRPDAATVAALLGPPEPGTPSLLEHDWCRTAARITLAMLRALAAAHALGVTHRDLKPGNVLLRPGGRPVLLDFGLAGLADLATGTLTARLIGTIAYMAPEQIGRMRTGKDVRIDVYQCGLVLFELLTFRRAFAGEDRAALLDAVRRGVVGSPRDTHPDVPQALADVCLHALEPDPGRRYATAEAFAADLERWLDGGVPAAARLGHAGRAWRRLRRAAGRHRGAVVAAALFVVGAGSAFWATRPSVAIVATPRADGRFDVRTRADGVVCAWLTSLDQAGTSLGTYPLRLQVDDSAPRLQLRLPGGSAVVRTIESTGLSALPGAVRTEIRWFVAQDERAADWMQLLQRVAEDANRGLQPVRNDRVRAIANELATAGRGGAGVGELPLDELLR